MLFDPKFPFLPKGKIYYGYVIIICAILAVIVSAPGQTIGVSVFIDYFIHALAITRTQLSMAYMIGTFTSAVLMAYAGRFIDDKGSRSVIFWTSIGLGFTLIGLSRMEWLSTHWITQSRHWHVIFLLSVLSIGFFFLRFLGQGLLSVLSRILILKWFVAGRGRVSGIVGIFATLAMSASPPLFNKMIQLMGWQQTYITLGAIIGTFFACFFWLFVRDTPESCHLSVDGPLFSGDGNNTAAVVRDWTLQEAKKTPTFWIFAIALSFYPFAMTAINFNIISIFQSAGWSRHAAISIFVPSAVVSIIVKLVSGYLCDHPLWRDRLKVQLAIYMGAVLTLCTGVLLLPVLHAAYYGLIGSMGIATGLYITLSSVCWGSFFGRLHVGSISSSAMSYAVFASALGPVFYSLLRDWLGGYRLPLLISLIIAALLFILSFWGDKPVFQDDAS